MSTPFSEMVKPLSFPRSRRPERGIWRLVAATGETRPYLVAHPEREIALVDMFGNAICEACQRMWRPDFTQAEKLEQINAHNAERHPRRWLRSQHGQVDPSVALDEARRVASWGADA